ncbi:hypothetical protein BDW22DRAFT_846564 [Trametopsis cervina]|nr:hypothetical protein BDW22DRAFT_846564 [Trametopsis cervina]
MMDAAQISWNPPETPALLLRSVAPADGLGLALGRSNGENWAPAGVLDTKLGCVRCSGFSSWPFGAWGRHESRCCDYIYCRYWTVDIATAAPIATAAGAVVEIYGTRRALVFHRPPFRKSDLLPDQTAASAVECLYGMAARDFSRVRFQASVSQNPAVRCGVVSWWLVGNLKAYLWPLLIPAPRFSSVIKDWTVWPTGSPNTTQQTTLSSNRPLIFFASSYSYTHRETTLKRAHHDHTA